MAFDGIMVAALCNELSDKLSGGRVDKLAQPEKDEIVLAIRNGGVNHRLMLTANASQPRISLTSRHKENPMTAPLFCMVLRKHLQGGRVVSVSQPDFERIIDIAVESPDELRDLSVKRLIIEIMGKHSNIILVNSDGIILDSIKRVSHETSSVREVLPGKLYTRPPSQDKKNPLLCGREDFLETITRQSGMKLQNGIYQQFTGISPAAASEICNRAGLDSSSYAGELDEVLKERLYKAFNEMFEGIRRNEFKPAFYRDGKRLMDFSAVEMSQYSTFVCESFESPSALAEEFYREKDAVYRGNQKTLDLRRLIQTHIERCLRKKEQYIKTAAEIENREQNRSYGELVRASLYMLKAGMTEFEALDYSSGEGVSVRVPLIAEKNPSENMQHYFKLYNKQKRTYQALLEQDAANESELVYLDSAMTMLASCFLEAELEEVRAELASEGYLKKKQGKAAKIPKTRLLRFVSVEGYEILVGKNNTQNDELTFKTAAPNDIWLHAKDIPGSHVIIRAEGKEPGDETITYAAKLAAYFSKAKGAPGTAVDYTMRRNVKKPNGSKPGFVIYDKNKTAYVGCSEEEILNAQ